MDMRKIDLDSINSTDIIEWEFPAISRYDEEEEDFDDLDSVNDNEVANEVSEETLRLQEYERLKNEVNDRIALLTDIAVKLNNFTTNIDSELIDVIKTIMKMTIKKIILKDRKSTRLNSSHV